MRVRKVSSARELKRSRALLVANVDASFLDEFDASGEHWQVLTADGSLAGVAGATLYEDDAELHLSYCVVAPDQRGSGMQAALLEAREAWGKRRGCHKVCTYVAWRSWGSIINLTRAHYKVVAIEDYFLCAEKDLV